MTSIEVMILRLVSSPSQRLVVLPWGSSYVRARALTFSTWQRRGSPLTSPLRWSPTYSARVSPFPRILFPTSDRWVHVNYQTGAIAWRIFHSGKPLGGTWVLWPVVFVIIESSALYAFGVIAVLATFLSGSNGQYIAVDAIVPLVVSRALLILSCTFQLIYSLFHVGISQGIVFSMIVLQIRFHISSSINPRSDGQISANGENWPRLPGPPVGVHEPEYPMQLVRMAVHVTKQTHTHMSTHDIDGDSSSDGGMEKPTAL